MRPASLQTRFLLFPPHRHFHNPACMPWCLFAAASRLEQHAPLCTKGAQYAAPCAAGVMMSPLTPCCLEWPPAPILIGAPAQRRALPAQGRLCVFTPQALQHSHTLSIFALQTSRGPTCSVAKHFWWSGGTQGGVAGYPERRWDPKDIRPAQLPLGLAGPMPINQPYSLPTSQMLVRKRLPPVSRKHIQTTTQSLGR